MLCRSVSISTVMEASKRSVDATYTNRMSLEVTLEKMRRQGACSVGIIAAGRGDCGTTARLEDDLRSAGLCDWDHVEGSWLVRPKPPLLVVDGERVVPGPDRVRWESTLFVVDADVRRLRRILRKHNLTAAVLVDLGEGGRVQLVRASGDCEGTGAATPENIAVAYGRTRSTTSRFTGWKWPSGRWARALADQPDNRRLVF
ncbi:MAG: hypothetical protein M0R80_24995 [Proteobacteria bacterium]|jgi:hypothetical protein|nr:hypothetical protein [Pseudomonadota bacterium]